MVMGELLLLILKVRSDFQRHFLVKHRLSLIFFSSFVPEGKVYKDWNSKRMAWAYAIVNDKSSTKFSVHFGCNRDEDFVEEITIP